MSLSFYAEKKPCNVIPIFTMESREKRRGHDSPRICQMLKLEVNCFFEDTAVFQDMFKEKERFQSRNRLDAQSITSDSELNTGNIPVPDFANYMGFGSFSCHEQYSVSGTMYIQVLVINI